MTYSADNNDLIICDNCDEEINLIKHAIFILRKGDE